MRLQILGALGHGALLLLMEEILHHLIGIVYPSIYRGLYIPGGCLGFLPSTVYSIIRFTPPKTNIAPNK